MNAATRLHLAWQAESARMAGKPGKADEIELHLSAGMTADYVAFLATERERHVAAHHRRRPRFPGRP